MNTRFLAAFGMAALLGAAGAAAATPQTITVTMNAENNSGESGTATLTELTNGVKVTLALTHAPSTAQPTHIHAGTCTKLNPAPELPLTSTINGKSTTMLTGKKLSDFSGGKFSINVHKSTNDLKTYVSCGTIK